ncbi:MAG: acetyl-CoA synthase subunit gamma [Deltaproteobacteria bacterium]|nr:acetyl-CoA synthase subunit gamma [Deltaproteobacteria bacterium]
MVVPSGSALSTHFTDGAVDAAGVQVPRVRTALTWRDHWGTLLARWAIHRMDYRVAPGLYAAGTPDATSPVLVSANYKMSFDCVRSALAGRHAWLLVLDTAGINVWCAAGKGTFGTDELVRRVADTGLDRVVSHRKLVVPQLGAPGVAAHEVRQRCGFRVMYGPVRAEDLAAFLDAGMKASPEMRQVRFNLRDRMTLSPVELMQGYKVVLPVAAVLLLLGGLRSSGWSWDAARQTGGLAALLLFAAFTGAAVLGPALLPWLPGRAFSVKGAMLGVAFAALLPLTGGAGSPWHTAAWALLIPALASFALMNFTGATTFTSLSGVLAEMRRAVPVQVTAAVVGLGLWVAGLWLDGGPTT